MLSKANRIVVLFLFMTGILCGLSITRAQAQGQTIIYNQPPSATGMVYLSSWWTPNDSDHDQYVYDEFTLPSAQSISEIQWRGAFDPAKLGSGGPVLDFTVAIYASIPAGTQPDVVNPPLVKYETGGNAGQTPAGTIGITTFYDYRFALPTPFQAVAGTKYWVQIEAWQNGVPDWCIAQGTGGGAKHFRKYSNGVSWVYQSVLGDASFKLLSSVNTVENSDYRIQYDGWIGVKNSLAKGAYYRVSNVLNDWLSFTFSGTAFTWITTKGWDMGIARVTIDGVIMPDVDLYSAKRIWRFAQNYGGLADGAHTVVIEVAGQKNPASTNSKIVFDAAVIGVTTLQESSYKVKYNDWAGKTSTKASKGNYRTNGTAGAVAQLKFTGDQIDWITVKGPKYGQAEVFIDGVSQGVIDLYQATAQWQVPISFTGLGAGVHTIQVEVLGTGNVLSTGTDVVLDAFKGPIIPKK